MCLADEIYSQGFHIIDNFLEPSVFQALRETAEFMHNQGHFKQAKVGHQINAAHHSNIRNDKICWLDEDSTNSAVNRYFTRLHEIAKILNQSLFLGLQDFETHFAIYQPGSFYKKHVDQFKGSTDRRISCVYYLNAEWQEKLGGQLMLYDCDDKPLTSVLPQGNRFVCFSSELPHEVCTTQETRYSITGWMKTRSSSIS
ncbi:2OG-Fe(II) oxygenase [Legionella massiliensis]|nr:2OG-Fe(II) oxygenase [Legionella massiliensis]